MTLSITTQDTVDTEYCYAKCRFAECRGAEAPPLHERENGGKKPHLT
jgi:hypothetical protein